jgi:hypothetical protein
VSLMTTLFLLGGCTSTKDGVAPSDDSDPTGGTDDTNDTPECVDEDCAFDEFCHNDACEQVDGRSFDLSFGPLVVAPDKDWEGWWYGVSVRYGSGPSCFTEHLPSPVTTWSLYCEMVVDFDIPTLTIALNRGLESDAALDPLVEWELNGIDDLVGAIRMGTGVLVAQDLVELTASFEPNFD